MLTLIAYSFIIVIISSIIGNYVEKILGAKMLFKAPLGFFAFLSILFYVYIPIISFKLPSIVLHVTTIIILVILLFLSLKEIKITFDIKKVILILICFLYVGIKVFQVSDYTLDEKHSDATYYIGLVTQSVDIDHLASHNPEDGTEEDLPIGYKYQAFYFFSSFIVWVASIPNKLGIYREIGLGNTYIWVTSILFFTFYAMTMINTINALAKTKFQILILSVFSILLLGFFYGSFYYNLTFAFYGNSWRFIIVSNIFLYIYMFFKHDKIGVILFIMFTSLISVSSSGFFFSATLLYAISLLLLLKKHNQRYLKIMIMSIPIAIYSLVYLPIYLTLSLTSTLFFIITWVLVYGIMFLFHKRIIDKDQVIAKIALFAVPLVLILVSIFLVNSGWKYDFAYFFEDNAYRDMIWPYMMWDVEYYRKMNYLIFGGLTVFLLFRLKECNIINSLLLIFLITFFNPLVIPVITKFLTSYIYYRMYGVLFNIFTICLFVTLLFKLKYKILIIGVSLMLLIYIFPVIITESKNHYNYLFEADESINSEYRIDNDDLDVLNHLKYFLDYNNIYNPKILSHPEASMSVLPLHSRTYTRHDYFGKWSTGKEKGMLLNHSFEEVELFKMVYRPEYYKDPLRPPIPTDYSGMCNLVAKTEIDFIIIDKNVTILNEDTNEFYSIWYEIDKCVDYLYENETYVLFDARKR